MSDDRDPTATENPSATAGDKTQKGGSPFVKLLLELGPLLVFFVTFNKFGIYTATASFMTAMVAAIGFSYWRDRSVSPMLWVTLVIVMVMGGLTLYLRDDTFVKMKPTMVNGLFSATLFGGLLVGKPLIRSVMGSGMPDVSERGWIIVTRNWGLFFGLMAVINECVWRTVTTDTWVTVKTFGYLPLTFIFAISQVPVLIKHGAKFDLGDDEDEEAPIAEGHVAEGRVAKAHTSQTDR